jgi:hypothetical protein
MKSLVSITTIVEIAWKELSSMSENVWQSQVSQEMIDESGLSDNEVGKLIEELDDAVARICEEFGIE